MHRLWQTVGEKEAMKELLFSNKILLDKLKKLCYTRIKDTEKTRRSSPDYSDSNWAIKQADMNGYLRCLHDLEELFKLDGDNTHDQ